MPGVVDTSDGRDAPMPSSIANIYILGGRKDSKNMTIDGVSNLDTGSNQTVHSMPSMDSVAEVKVLMSAYSAENGRNPSSINVITKGGGTAVPRPGLLLFPQRGPERQRRFSPTKPAARGRSTATTSAAIRSAVR